MMAVHTHTQRGSSVWLIYVQFGEAPVPIVLVLERVSPNEMDMCMSRGGSSPVSSFRRSHHKYFIIFHFLHFLTLFLVLLCFLRPKTAKVVIVSESLTESHANKRNALLSAT